MTTKAITLLPTQRREDQLAARTTVRDVEVIAEHFRKSGFFSDSRELSQAVTKILAGRELGIGPMTAMTGIYIVKGRITLSANLIAACIKRSGKYGYRVKELTNERCVIAFTEDGDELVPLSVFTTDDAKKAGLSGGDNWVKYPRNMLFARAMSNGAKFHTPDVFGGPVYTPDELGAAVNGETGEAIPERPRIEAPKPFDEAGPITMTAWKTQCPIHMREWLESPRGHWHPEDAMDGGCLRTPTLAPLIANRLQAASARLGLDKKALTAWLKERFAGTWSALNTDTQIDAMEALEATELPGASTTAAPTGEIINGTRVE